MTQQISMGELESLNDIEWFDAMCKILAKERCPKTNQLTLVIGTEDSGFSRQDRGSKFLVPFDKRFKSACINPDLSASDIDKPIDYLSFGGADFNLKMTDLLQRFPDYTIQRNTYDGLTQIFFYPISDSFEFSALSFEVVDEVESISDVNLLIFHHVAFLFGENVVIGRDGYHVRR